MDHRSVPGPEVLMNINDKISDLKTEGVAQLVECLLSMIKGLGLSPSIA